MPPSNSMRPVCVACHCVRTIADAGANARDKIPSARLCAKNAGGLCVGRGGGVFVGHYSINTLTPTDFLQLFYILQ